MYLERPSQPEFNGEPDCCMLVPLLDFFNHSPSAQVFMPPGYSMSVDPAVKISYSAEKTLGTVGMLTQPVVKTN